MGRGRAKAKQTKVARELKYASPTMDLEALQRELGGGAVQNGANTGERDDVEDYDDPYASEFDDDDEPATRAR